MALAFTVAFSSVTPAFATEAETNEVLEEKEDTIETTELEPSAQSLDVDEDNELEEVVKTWVAKNPEYEKEVELENPYRVGRTEVSAKSVIKFTIAKSKGRYVAYAKGEDRIAMNSGGIAGENYLWFIIPHNGYYNTDFDEDGYCFYDEDIRYTINSKYKP